MSSVMLLQLALVMSAAPAVHLSINGMAAPTREVVAPALMKPQWTVLLLALVMHSVSSALDGVAAPTRKVIAERRTQALSSHGL